MQNNGVHKFVWIYLFLITGSLLLFEACQKSKPINAGFGETGIYVWQTSSTEPVLEACKNAESKTDAFLFYAGNVTIRDNQFVLEANPYDWQKVSSLKKTFSLVYRFADSIPDFLHKHSIRENAVALAIQILDHLSTVQKAGCRVFEIQLDYDCPTAKLPDYIIFLKVFRQELGGMKLSITALPDWYNQKKEVKALFDLVDYHVLQVHSLVFPKNTNETFTIFDKINVSHYVQQADSLNYPYYVSLPTYGYELKYGPSGEFIGLRAEDMGFGGMMSGMASKTRVMTDMTAVRKAVIQLRLYPSKYRLGILWFRLPVKGDELNWPWETLLAIMEGKMPAIKVDAEFKKVEENLYEIWLHNRGDTNVPGSVVIEFSMPDQSLAAYDMFGEYNLSPMSSVGGPAPKMGKSACAGWFRFKPDSHITDKDFVIKEVKVR